MFNPDTDFLFPSRVIPKLSGLRGEEWDVLVEKAQTAGEDTAEHLSFILMMVKLNGCESCNADSFKAMRGCTACSVQSIQRFSGRDAELAKRYEKASGQVRVHLNSIHKRD